MESTDPYRYRHGWTGDARHDAAERFNESLHLNTDLLPTAEVAAETVREILQADAVTMSIIQGDSYRELVNVGTLQDDQVRIPPHQIYPMDTYPAATERLLAGRGYLSTSKALDVVQEYIAQSPRPVVGCFMGVPIVASGQVRGEIWALRGLTAPPFLPEDLDLVADLATQFGARLPELLERQKVIDPTW